jgi:hypothetical protein
LQIFFTGLLIPLSRVWVLTDSSEADYCFVGFFAEFLNGFLAAEGFVKHNRLADAYGDEGDFFLSQ